MEAFTKKELSEANIRTKFITPAITQAGWEMMNQLREEVYFTAGRLIVRASVEKQGNEALYDLMG